MKSRLGTANNRWSNRRKINTGSNAPKGGEPKKLIIYNV